MTLTHTISVTGIHLFYSPARRIYLRVTDTSIVEWDSRPPAFKREPTKTISCILGIIKLKVNKYIIVVDKHEVVGTILGSEIGKVKSFRIIAIGKKSISKDSEEDQYLSLLHQHLRNATLFFSVDNTYDLTNSLQRQLGSDASSNSSSSLSLSSDISKRDSRFWWNEYLCEEFIENQAEAFVTPVIYGYVKSHSTQFRGSNLLEFALITRRSHIRAGTRYFRRGIDDTGAAANFNETEQVLTTANGQIYSFLQTRGSVPVYWSEINNLKYKPNLVISSRPAQDATAKHFRKQVDLYGDNFLVNLVNQKGYEKPVKSAYEKAVETLPESLAPHVNYIYFDFHHECRKMRWDRVKILIERLVQLGYTSDNYFAYDLDSKSVLSLQKKIVRTNCMDCLDRTNVVQSMLGRWVLEHQLERAHYLPQHESRPWELVDPTFNLFFQSFWADNADAVSTAYSGTGALKTDYTRTGQRTKMGAWNDLVNSVTRYYLNNYKDGSRQDSYDLFLGAYRPYQESISNPFLDKRAPYTQLVPYLIGASLFVLVVLLFYPSGSVTSLRNLCFIGGCLYFGVRNTRFVAKHGYQFVNWPKLRPLDYLKKTEVFNLDGRFVGIKYEENDDFKTSKKRN